MLGIDIRDVTYDSMEAIVNDIRSCLSRLETERGVTTTFERPYDIEPTAMNDRCLTALHEAASKVGVSALELHSGAGHDTMHIANVTDAGMVFAPSRGGISHSPREWTDWTHCATATKTITEGLAELATE